MQDVTRNRRIGSTRMETAVLKFLYRRAPGVVDRGVLARDVGAQCQGDDTHLGDPHLPSAPEDRGQSNRPHSAAQCPGRLQAQFPAGPPIAGAPHHARPRDQPPVIIA